jgi:predicted DNA-binding transcriptional regulator AlpA
MENPSPFLLPSEVDEISRLCDVTRRRHESRGQFPKRVYVTGRKIVYRKSDIEEWAADPEGWRARNALRSAS